MEVNVQSIGSHDHLNQFMSVDAVEAWADHLGFEVVGIYRGDEPYFPLAAPVVMSGGHVYENLGTLGQSAAILKKPFA
jgi:hypothetical protein